MYKNRITNLQIKFPTSNEFGKFVSYSSKVYWTINDDSLALTFPIQKAMLLLRRYIRILWAIKCIAA